MAWAAMVVGALITFALAATATANGRAPVATGITCGPRDASAIYARTTFGLLVSRDDGCSFRWVCERALGYAGDFDPKLAVSTDGTLFAATYGGLRVSRDDGCTWTEATAELPARAPGRIAGMWIDAIDIAATGEIWIATAESAAPNNVYRSSDNGMTFEPRNLHSPTVWWKSVRVAPSNARRIYVTGYQVAGTPTARLQRSDDAGTSWTERPLAAAMQRGATPMVVVSAIDPMHPDTLFVTSIGATPPSGDRLYRSIDGGATFLQVLEATGRIRDVIHAADGSVYVATSSSGTHRSTDGGLTFHPLAGASELGCLAQRADGTLIGCDANREADDRAIMRSVDGASWQPSLAWSEVAGPLACAPGTTVHDVCEPMWPALRAALGASGPAKQCPLAPARRQRATPPRAAKRDAGGCCETGSPRGATGTVLLAITLGGVLRRRRRVVCG